MQGEEGGCAVLDSSQLKVVGLSWLEMDQRLHIGSLSVDGIARCTVQRLVVLLAVVRLCQKHCTAT